MGFHVVAGRVVCRGRQSSGDFSYSLVFKRELDAPYWDEPVYDAFPIFWNLAKHDDKSCVVPDLYDLLLIFSHLRFDKHGCVSHVSPPFLRYMAKVWYTAKHKKTTPTEALHGVITTGPATQIQHVSPLPLWDMKKAIHPSFCPCKAKFHRDFSASISPHAEYVFGKPVCTTCYSILENTKGYTSWIDVHSLAGFNAVFLNDTWDKLDHVPLRFILAGMVHAIALDPNTPLSLQAYEHIGRNVISNPTQCLYFYNFSKSRLRFISSIFGKLTLVELATRIEKSQLHNIYKNENLLEMRDNLMYFGWARIKRLHKAKSIVSTEDSKDPYVFRKITVDKETCVFTHEAYSVLSRLDEIKFELHPVSAQHAPNKIQPNAYGF